MKHAFFVKTLSLLLLLSLLFSLISCGDKITITSLGTPYEALSAIARVPWDLFVHQGHLYIGAGESVKNISPALAKRYAFADNVWQDCGKITDEQINRFLTLNGKLYIPATDPQIPWEEGGGYYLLENGSFQTHYTIPQAVHTLDMAYYDGKLFAAIGTVDKAGIFPVVCQNEDGSFAPVPLLKNQKEVPHLDTTNLIYDFFEFDGKLYLLYSDGLFVYKESHFDFVSAWTGLYQTASETYVPILAKAEFQNRFFFTTQHLYVCQEENGNLGTPSALDLDGYTVSDLLVYDGTLYLLASKNRTIHHKIKVLKSTDGEHFSTLFSFERGVPAVSFATDGKSFYLGMGEMGKNNEKNGEILKIDLN